MCHVWLDIAWNRGRNVGPRWRGVPYVAGGQLDRWCRGRRGCSSEIDGSADQSAHVARRPTVAGSPIPVAWRHGAVARATPGGDEPAAKANRRDNRARPAGPAAKACAARLDLWHYSCTSCCREAFWPFLAEIGFEPNPEKALKTRYATVVPVIRVINFDRFSCLMEGCPRRSKSVIEPAILKDTSHQPL